MKKFILITLILSCVKSFENLDFKTKGIDENLALFIKSNQNNKAIKSINEGANINYTLDGRSVLDLALYNKNVNIVKELIKKGVEINKKNEIEIYDLALDDFNCGLIDLIKDRYKLEEGSLDRNKYFLLLCYTSNAEEVKNFIEKYKIDPKAPKDKVNRNALIIASMEDKIDIFKMLVETYNLDIQSEDNLGKIPLTSSCIFNSNNILEYIIKLQSNYANYIDEALKLACEGGHIEIVKTLLEKGANVNDNDNDNSDEYDALMLASLHGHVEIVKLLTEKGADVNKRGYEGDTALTRAVLMNRIEIIKILIKAGANINETTNSGWTPLTLASSNGNKELVELLLEEGANANQRIKENTDYEYNTEEDGWTALMIASRNGHMEVVKKLISAGANINDKNKEDWTALMIASQNGHAEVVKTLIELGVNIHEKDLNAVTALMIASREGNVEVIRTLIELGANIHDKTNRGSTVLSFSFPNEDAMKLLVQNGATFADNESELLFKFLIRSKNQIELLELIFNKNIPNIRFLSFIYKKALELKSGSENDLVKNVSKRRKGFNLSSEDGNNLIKNILREINISEIFLMDNFMLNNGSLLINCFLNFVKLCKLGELEYIIEIKKLILEVLIEYSDEKDKGTKGLKIFETRFNSIRNKINVFVSRLSKVLSSFKWEVEVEKLVEALKEDSI